MGCAGEQVAAWRGGRDEVTDLFARAWTIRHLFGLLSHMA
jgi:hypothetical protein